MNTSPASGAAAQPVRVRRHCLERPFFVLATLVTLALLAAALTVSAFREETAQWLQEDAIKEFRENNPEDAKLSDREILRMLPADTRDDIKTVRELEWWLVALAPLGLLALFIWNIGQIYGTARADGIQVTTRQFPQAHALWTEMAGQLGFKKVPELYVQNGNGTLNAYATCVPGYRAFGVIYSDILERALANEDEKILRFILGHELGHIRLKHVAW